LGSSQEKMSDRRERFRHGLSSLYLPHYELLCQELPPEWQPYYGSRSFYEQDLLFASGRSRPGRILTEAKGGESPHNYGCASDWCLWDERGVPYWPPVGDSVWQVYANACEKAGLRWGGDFHRPDGPHNELWIDCSWPHILVEYTKGGMRMAQEHIERNLRK
jgi:hypothetical protein